MTLRIVAGERCGKWRLESTREPTGSAESTYSRIRATRTSRCRASIYSILQQVDKQRVREDEPGLRQARPRTLQQQVTRVAPLLDPARQGGLAGRALGQPTRRHAVARAQPQDQALGQALARREALGGLDGRRARLDGGAPARERLDVAVAHVAHEPAAAGPGREVLGGAPVAEVVACAAAPPGGVGGLVVLEAAGGGGADESPVLRDDLLLPRQAVHAARGPPACAVGRPRRGGDLIR